MTYLILRLATLGNVAMTVPVIDSLSRRYPDDRFIIASKKPLGAMFASMPNVEFREVDNHIDWRGIWALWQEWRKEIDAMIDLQAVLRTRVFGTLMRLSGKRVTRVHYGRIRKHLITVWGIGKKNLPTEFARYRDAFRRAGLETDEAFTALPVNKSALRAVKNQFGEKEGRWIGLAPFAKSRSNMLPYRVTRQEDTCVPLRRRRDRMRDVTPMVECVPAHGERCRTTETGRGTGADASVGCDALYGQCEPTFVEFSGSSRHQCLVRYPSDDRLCGLETAPGRHHPTA